MLTLEAWLDGMDTITIYVKNTYYDGKVSKFYLKSDEKKELIPIVGIVRDEVKTKYVCKLNHLVKIGRDYEVLDDHGLRTTLKFGRVVRTSAFDQRYFYDGDDLGNTYTQEKSTFKLWAPTAMRVKIDLLSPDGVTETFDLYRGKRGVWDVTLLGDFEGYSYVYLLKVNGTWNEATDPYAYSSLPNHKRSVIVDLKKTEIDMNLDKQEPFLSFTDAVIYEMSVRDFSVHKKSGIKNKAKFLGVVEEGTTLSGHETGFDYLKSLGVTHLQFLPIYDFGSVDEDSQFDYYNWGYDPVQYNVPEGSYASHADDPYSRIVDLKTMVSKINGSGMRVVMDVVYNHMFDLWTSAFENIVPGYYFRHDSDDKPSNGSFCGNDLSSDRKMVRKYIVDSVKMWANEYGVRGFRFDLMGILDIETMNQVRNELDLIDETILVYGEGWNMPTALPDRLKATNTNWKKIPRIGQFNDFYRDSVKGKTPHDEATHRGYVGGESFFTSHVMAGLLGSVVHVSDKDPMFGQPFNTINYVSCHDNHTLWDKLTISNPNDSNDMRRRRQRLANAIVLLSQGIAFLHMGQEFNRTKNGDHNSYLSSDVINAIDWERVYKYQEDVDYVKKLIALRRKMKVLHLDTTEDILAYTDIDEVRTGVIDYQLKRISEFCEYDEVRILINGTEKEQVLDLLYDYHVIVEGTTVSMSPIRENVKVIKVSPLSVTILVK